MSLHCNSKPVNITTSKIPLYIGERRFKFVSSIYFIHSWVECLSSLNFFFKTFHFIGWGTVENYRVSHFILFAVAKMYYSWLANLFFCQLTCNKLFIQAYSNFV
jgi:hypothetical protein